MIWAWLLIILFILFMGLGAFIVIKVLISLERKRRASEVLERIFGDFVYTDEEWQYVHQNQFVDDVGSRGFLDGHSSVISWSGSRSKPSARGIKFTDQYVYLFGDGEQKIFKVHSLGPSGTTVHLQSIRMLDLQPLKKLQLKVYVSIKSTFDYRDLEFNLEYLLPLPKSAYGQLAEIEREYGELILSS